MSNLQIDPVLAQIRSLQSQIRSAGGPPGAMAQLAGASGGPAAAAAGPGAAGAVGAGAQAPASFANVIRQGLDQVNATQQHATALAAQFERGVPGVELPQVMLEMQKASVSFRAVAEVRNRFVSAYQEIMNMPI